MAPSAPRRAALTLLCWSSLCCGPGLAGALRAGLPVQPEAPKAHEAGVPHGLYSFDEDFGKSPLKVLYTSSEAEAADFLLRFTGARHFGLDMKYRPFNHGSAPHRASLLEIAMGTQILVFDLVPWRRSHPEPLPAALRDFLESDMRTFYGMNLASDLARLAFELDCLVTRGIDFRRRVWPELKLGGGLVGLAGRVLNIEAVQHTWSDWDVRPLPKVELLRSAAQDAYLCWAFAVHFVSFHGEPEKAWFLTKSDLYGAGLIWMQSGLAVRDSRHDWREPAEEYISKKMQQDSKKKGHKAAGQAKRKRSPVGRVTRQTGRRSDGQPRDSSS